MRKPIVIAGAVVIGLILLAIAVPLLLPAEIYRDRIRAIVEDATGRKLDISGPVSFALLPSVAIEASGITLSNAPGGVAKDMATIGKMAVGVRLFPLLSGEIQIERFVLTDPVIHLEVDKNGHQNWDFSKPTAPAAGGPAAQAAAQQQAIELSQLRLGEVKLINGTIDYADARTNQHDGVSQVGLSVTLPSLDEASSLDGALTWHGKAIKLAASIDKPRILIGPGDSKAKISLSSELLSFAFDGVVTGGTPLKSSGTIDIRSSSVRQLATWAGMQVPIAGDGLGAFLLKSNLTAAGAKIAFTSATLSLDAIKAKGDVAVDSSGARPSIKGKLDVETLDLNPYLAKPGNAPAAPSGSPNPQTQQSAASTDWSAKPIDFSALKASDLDFALTTSGIDYQKIVIGKSVLTLKLQNGRLAADLGEMALYSGAGKGKIALDASAMPAALSADFSLSGVQAKPLLDAAIGFERVTGTGVLDFALTSRGASQRDLIGGLAGKGSFGFKDGTIQGIDLAAMSKNIEQALLSAATAGSQQTQFANLSGTFTVANGIVKNDDLALQSPVMQVGGSGTVDLPQQRLDYRVEPKLAVASQDLSVPILITGPWSGISYRPDVKGILNNKLKNPGSLLQGIMGNKAGGGSGSKPADVLKGLFGK